MAGARAVVGVLENHRDEHEPKQGMTNRRSTKDNEDEDEDDGREEQRNRLFADHDGAQDQESRDRRCALDLRTDRRRSHLSVPWWNLDLGEDGKSDLRDLPPLDDLALLQLEEHGKEQREQQGRGNTSPHHHRDLRFGRL